LAEYKFVARDAPDGELPSVSSLLSRLNEQGKDTPDRPD
jgi:hypothetical protein